GKPNVLIARAPGALRGEVDLQEVTGERGVVALIDGRELGDSAHDGGAGGRGAAVTERHQGAVAAPRTENDQRQPCGASSAFTDRRHGDEAAPRWGLASVSTRSRC